jgi:hypothetical protein
MAIFDNLLTFDFLKRKIKKARVVLWLVKHYLSM